MKLGKLWNLYLNTVPQNDLNIILDLLSLNWTKLVGFKEIGSLKHTGDFEIAIPILSIEAKRKIHHSGEIGIGLSFRANSIVLFTDKSSTSFITGMKYNLNYFDISANFDLTVFRNFYLSTNIVFGYLVEASGHINFHTLGGGYVQNADYFPKRDLGIKLGIGYRYRKLDFRLKYYFGLNVLDSDGKARMIQFDVGYRIIN